MSEIGGVKFSKQKPEEGFLFPRTIFVDLVNLKAQVEKAESEIFEVHQLLGKKNINLNQVAEELEDAMQALETLRRILLEKYNVNVYLARVQVIRKNKRKKYYFEGDQP
jgi:DNA repair exonuclease SbcCD ATPase subunit